LAPRSKRDTVIGATKVSQWEDVMGCLRFELTKEIMAELDEVSKIELPFPQKFFMEPDSQDVLYGNAKGKMLDSRY